jgi:hypothetical protein
VRVPLIWGEYFAGHNPDDPFRGRPIIPSTEYEAGFPDTLAPMLSWTWQESGAGNLVRWDPRANTKEGAVSLGVEQR